MDNDIQKLCQECPVCQLTKTQMTNRPELGEIADSSTIQPLKFWSIDFQGPFRTSKSGNRFIIFAIDYSSKWVEALCTSDATAVTTAQFILEQIILRHGTPDTIHTDQGTNFESKLIEELCRLYKIKKTRS
jgi:transposase InsO family protein